MMQGNIMPMTTSAPASASYVDLQLNGYAGVDFNHDEVTIDQLHAAFTRLAADGVAATLGTLVTAPAQVMQRRIRKLVQAYHASDVVRRVMVGLHVEGPSLNPEAGYRGAHDPSVMVPATPELMKSFLEAGEGLVRIVTLAPECDPDCAATRFLARAGCIVSAGHTNASLDQLKAAIDAGLSMVTHLGNGCPMTMHRHDNIIQRCLHLREHLTLCFIADGVHIPFFALANYLNLVGVDRAVVVTDAISAAGMGPGKFTLGHQWVLEVGEDLAVWSPDRSHLVGSAMTMKQAQENLRKHLHLSPSDIIKLTRDNPAAALGLTVHAA
jgi:N-acetylglucosamine-6-phosphate deacetylase